MPKLFHHFVMLSDVASVGEPACEPARSLGGRGGRAAARKPLAPSGAPATLCEYSNTPFGAMRDAWGPNGRGLRAVRARRAPLRPPPRARADDAARPDSRRARLARRARQVLKDPAPFHELELFDYVENAGRRGIYRVVEPTPLSDAQVRGRDRSLSPPRTFPRRRR